MSCRCLVLLVSDMGKAPWGVCSEGLPVRVVRRRATLPHPVGCSTIAVPGLSFRVRNGTGRLTWAMAAVNLLLYGQTLELRPVAAREPDSGRDMSMLRLGPDNAYCRLASFAGGDAVQPPGVGMLVLPSSVSTGRLHPRGLPRPAHRPRVLHGDQEPRRFHGMVILEQASRLDAFSAVIPSERSQLAEALA